MKLLREMIVLYSRWPLLILLTAFQFLLTEPAFAESCFWREPKRTFPVNSEWHCSAQHWTDGDTFAVLCRGPPEPITIRVPGVDTVERGDPRWRASRAELRKRTEFTEIRILPHHPNRGRIVADVIVRGMNVGQDMHATGWSKARCPRL